MNGELARKRPANVQARRHNGSVLAHGILAAPPQSPEEVWTDGRYALQARLRRAVARGEVAQSGDWRPVRGAPGWYSVTVRRIKRPAPRWHRPIAAVGGALSLLAGLGVAALVLIPAWMGVLLAGFGALCIVAAVVLKVRSSRTIVINQVVNVRK